MLPPSVAHQFFSCTLGWPRMRSLFDGDSHSSSWLSLLRGWTGFSLEHLSLCSNSIFGLGAMVPSTGRWPLKSWILILYFGTGCPVGPESMGGRAKCLLLSPTTPGLLTSAQERPRHSPDYCPWPRSFLVIWVSEAAISLPPCPLPRVGLTTRVLPDSHHLDLSTLHHYTSLYLEQYPRKKSLEDQQSI